MATATITTEYRDIPVENLEPDPLNPRGDNLGDLEGLARTISAVGILQPLVVRPNGADDHFVIITGHRRFAAAQIAGLKVVPAMVKPTDKPLEQMLIENVQREDLTPLQEAAAYQSLIDENGLTQRGLSERVGRSQSHISKYLSLLRLPERFQAMLANGKMTIVDAIELAKLADDPADVEEAFRYAGTGFNRTLAQAVDAALGQRKLRKKVEDAVKAAEAEGKVVIRMEEYEGNAALVGEGSLSHVDPKKHAKLDCDVLTPDAYNPGELVHACIDPLSHREKPKVVKAPPVAKGDDEASAGEQSVGDEPGEEPEGEDVTIEESPAEAKARIAEEKRQAHQVALLEARKGRAEFIDDLMDKRVAQGDVFDLAARTWIGSVGQDLGKAAMKILGLATPDSEGYKTAASILRDHVEEQPKDLSRVLLAVAIASRETTLRFGRIAEHPDYFEFLEKRGYAVTKAERAELTGKGLPPQA